MWMWQSVNKCEQMLKMKLQHMTNMGNREYVLYVPADIVAINDFLVVINIYEAFFLELVQHF